jgi:hypothetical protein
MNDDPVGLDSGDTNIGRYVGNVPASHRDPTGHFGSWGGAGTTIQGKPINPFSGKPLNGETNATDPTGLVKLKMSDLSSALQGIAQSQAAKDEAAKIAATINATWEMNMKWNWAASSFFNEKARGFYCYEWAYAFQDANSRDLQDTF